MAPSKRKPKLDEAAIDRGIDEARALAEAQDITIALAGGVALSFYGSDRLTVDVDFLADRKPDVPAPKALAFGGVQFTTPSGIVTDFIVRDDEYEDLYDEALAFAARIDGVPVRVVTAEHMIALKLGAGRNKDLADLEFLVLDAEDVDLPRARDIVRRHMGVYAAKEFDRYRESVAWERERKKR